MTRIVRFIVSTVGYHRRLLSNGDGWCHLVPHPACAECSYFWKDAHRR